MMITVLSAVLAAILAVPASAGGMEQTKIDFLTPALAEGLAQIKAAAPRWTSVSMDVRASQGFYDISEPSLRINMHGSKTANGQFYFNGFAGNLGLSFNAYPLNAQDPSQGYTMSGGWMNLSINRSGSNYSINGWVNQRSFWLQATPQPGGGFNLWGQMGMNLRAMGPAQNLWVTGTVDLNEFDEPSVAAVGAVLSVLNSLPAQPK